LKKMLLILNSKDSVNWKRIHSWSPSIPLYNSVGAE
jgi:hypothetical protein